MDCVSVRKRVKGNPYNHLEKHTPIMTQTSCGFEYLQPQGKHENWSLQVH